MSDCQICCEEFEEASLVRTTCPTGSHCFCRECYDGWCQSQTTQTMGGDAEDAVVCPTCRHPLPFTGTILITDHRGRPVHEKRYQDGEISGLQRHWDDEGRLLFERHILHRKRHGLGRDWWPSGQLKFEALFVHDNFVGWVRSWREDGTLLRETLYVNGNPVLS